MRPFDRPRLAAPKDLSLLNLPPNRLHSGTLPTFWSIGVSIALAEGLFAEQACESWLGRVGEATFCVLFVVGVIANTLIGFAQNHFVTSPLQLGVITILVLLLINVAVAIPAGMAQREGNVPSPWVTGITALVFGSLLLLVPMQCGWGAGAAMLVLDAIFLLLVFALSRRTNWTLLHTFSLGAAGAVVYDLHAFRQTPFGGGPVLARVGNGIFLAIALLLIVVGAKRTAALERESPRAALG